MTPGLSAKFAALSVSGPAGGLTIPNARVLSDGTAVFGYNNYIDPSFSQTTRADNFLFALGFLPHVEITGRLANYHIDAPPGYRPRDLSANVKFDLPKLFDFQPDIAFGRNDVGGGAPHFRTTYVAVSKDFGAFSATLGKAKGEPYLNGLFGGVELRFGNTGFAGLAERINKTSHLGLRYSSKPIAQFANATVVGTLQRSFGARAPDGSRFDHPTFAVNLVIPFGENAKNVKMPEPAGDAIWTPPKAYRNEFAAAVSPSVAASAPQRIQTQSVGAPAKPDDGQLLQALQTALEKAGLERVRIGLAGDRLVIEYENHRYNRNEVDAIGIALGLAARLSPSSVARLSAVTKKAGLPVYTTTVDRVRYRRFLEDGDRYEALDGLEVSLRTLNPDEVRWIDPVEGKRGMSRVVVEPILKSFVGTEFGAYDYSLAVKATAIVPLWKGAEGSLSYVRHVADSSAVENGPFSYAHQRTGLKSAMLSQSFWLSDRLLNVTSVGKLEYDYTGFQNEAIMFLPWRGDQVRAQYSRMRYSDAFLQSTQVNIGAFYRWNYQPLDAWIELGYNKYVENDRGPSVRLSRWFGDIEAQAYIRRSNQGTFAGFQLVFPITPRQGMRPGLTHIEGPGQFAYGLETKLANVGDCNCISTARGIAEEIPIVYSARNIFLNRGRIGKDYLATQLPRMREAALLFAPLE